MSHRDSVIAPPEGAARRRLAVHADRRFEIRERGLRRAVPPRGRPHAARQRAAEELPLRVSRARRRRGRRPPDRGADRAIRAQVGGERVLCGLSGGVDSRSPRCSHKAVGDQLTCVFVDNGLLRKDEADQVVETFRGALPGTLIHVTRGSGSSRARGRHRSGEEAEVASARSSSASSSSEAEELGRTPSSSRGRSIRRDRVRRRLGRGRREIKSHHNVGGLPERFEMELVEPLRAAFKDEVRRVGEGSGCPSGWSGATRSRARVSRSAASAR